VAQFSLVEMTLPILLSVPNVSEGRDRRTIADIGEAFAGVGDGGESTPSDVGTHATSAGSVRLMDTHFDGDHHRSVFTLAGPPGRLADALLEGAAVAVERIDVMHDGTGGDGTNGQHPHVGALDVAPIVYVRERDRGSACAEALVLADRIGEELAVPVFLYGELTAGTDRPPRTRAELRRGGVTGLAERLAAGEGPGTELRPDFGPARMHPTAGATLVAAREPLVAFNLQLAAPASLQEARRIAALLREGGPEGLPGLRAMGVALSGGVAQVSMNIERPLETPVAMVIEAVGRHAQVAGAELVGLAPRAAFDGFPSDVPLPGFDPARHVIENALGF
jgi:glutamate formiminotransferase/glutamate formiminotransferase/formiminotetrahydrofolate cyclodeaminase